MADTHEGEDLDGVVKSAETVSLKGGHVEDVDALDLAHELETLDTGSLLLAVNVLVMASPCPMGVPVRSEGGLA